MEHTAKLPPRTPGHGISPELRAAIRAGGVTMKELEAEVGALAGRAVFELALWALF